MRQWKQLNTNIKKKSKLLNYLTLTAPNNPAQPRHLAYYEYGDKTNHNVVICVHGLSRNGLDFELLANALAEKYRVICPDIAGRGKSDWLTNKDDYNYAIYVADIFALCWHLGLTQFDWVGTSMGGIIGMMIAAQQPNLIKKMVLNDVGSIVWAKGLKRISSYVGKQTDFTNEAEAKTYIDLNFSSWGIFSKEKLFNATFTKLPNGSFALAYDPDISKAFLVNSEEIKDVDLSAIWQAVTCPVLLLRGEVSDILSKETAESMCNRPAPTKLVEFAGIGHAPALMDDEQIGIIKDWLIA